VVLRYLLAAAHYRSNIEVVPDSMVEARTAFERVESFVLRAVEADPEVAEVDPASAAVPEAFSRAMDDDLGVPAALAVLHDTVRAGNTALAAGDVAEAAAAAVAVRAMADVLGIDPLDPHWAAGPTGGDERVRAALDQLVRAELDARAAARKQRDFATADAVRDRLNAAGIAVEDTADGVRWTLTDGSASIEGTGR
jgi:cysteinyl-tRNA synthetase